MSPLDVLELPVGLAIDLVFGADEFGRMMKRMAAQTTGPAGCNEQAIRRSAGGGRSEMNVTDMGQLRKVLQSQKGL